MTTLGCIADDFTGATDLAAALTDAGFRTIMTIGSPPTGLPDADAIVVALKTRTAPVDEAVRLSVEAIRGLTALGASRFYFKYCSTFDSTATGNIGPVADALLQETDAPLGVVVPSFPANGRTVFQGTLFVHDQPLAESPMRHHPLTPMTDSNVLRLLRPQTTSPVEHVPLAVVHSPEALAARLGGLTDLGRPPLVVLDAIDDDDLARIAAALPDGTLLTGGAALAGALTAPNRSVTPAPTDFPTGPSLIVSGSASAATREQVATARAHLPAFQLDLAALLADFDAEVHRLLDDVSAAWAESDRPVLVFATAELADLSSGVNRARDADLIERSLAQLVSGAVDRGARRIIVAGGETSGAVTSALGIRQLEMGPRIAPGVVWTIADTATGARVLLALKSGNFGDARMFLDAWELLA